MIVSLIFLFFFLVCCSGILFFLFCFFLPSIKLQYDGINEFLSSEKNVQKYDENEIPLGKDGVRAVVDSSYEKNNDNRIFVYNGEKNCKLFAHSYHSEYKNSSCCIGFGDCIKDCPQNAITIQNDVAVIGETCNGCGACLSSCPLNLISLAPVENNQSEDKNKKDFKFFMLCYKILSILR